MEIAEIVMKRRARCRIYYAIIHGRLPRVKTLKCTDCGEKQAVQYDHYLGYEEDHALDVQPVCGSCHWRRGFARGEHKLDHIGPLTHEGRFLSEAARKKGGTIGRKNHYQTMNLVRKSPENG